jgi:Na+-translocating ferredoxin:NAD+ oxidoreductase RnfA subunit
MIALVSIATSALYFFVLVPLKLDYLTTAMFALVILAAFLLCNRALKAKNLLGIEAPTALGALIAVIGAVLGAALFSAQAGSFLYGALTRRVGGAGSCWRWCCWLGVRERTALS